MFNHPIPRPRGAHVAETPTDSAYWDREADAYLDGAVLTRHGRRCSCCATSMAVAR